MAKIIPEEHQKIGREFSDALSVWVQTEQLPELTEEAVCDYLQSKKKRFFRKGITEKLEFVKGLDHTLAEEGLSEADLTQTEDSWSETRQTVNGLNETDHTRAEDGKIEPEHSLLQGRFQYICQRKFSFWKEEKVLFKKEEPVILRMTLQDGKVAEYFFQKNDVRNKDELIRNIMQWVMWGMFFGLLYVLFFMLLNNELTYSLIITGPIVGGILGYVAVAFRLSGSLVGNAVHTLSAMKQNDETKLQTSLVMESYQASFSYPAFENQIVARTCQLLLSEEYKKLEWFEQQALEGCLRDIVDAVWNGNIEYEGYQAEETDICIKLRLQMIDTYVTGKETFQRKDLFHMTVKRAIQTTEEDWHIISFWRESKS